MILWSLTDELPPATVSEDIHLNETSENVDASTPASTKINNTQSTRTKNTSKSHAISQLLSIKQKKLDNTFVKEDEDYYF